MNPPAFLDETEREYRFDRLAGSRMARGRYPVPLRLTCVAPPLIEGRVLDDRAPRRRDFADPYGPAGRTGRGKLHSAGGSEEDEMVCPIRGDSLGKELPRWRER